MKHHPYTLLRGNYRWGWQIVAGAAAVVVFGVYAPSAIAQGANGADVASQWPSKPIRIVVGFPAGSITDNVARIMADQMSKSLGQPVIVENKAGANGSIGVGDVARSPADGYTLLVTNSSSITINPQLYKKITYKAKDFTPVSMVIDAPFVLLVNPDWAKKNQINSAKEVINFAQRNPEKLSYGSAGPGNIAHLSFASWSNRTQTKSTHVPYKSGSQAQMAVLSGEIDAAFETWTALPHIQAGKLKPLAITAGQRMKQLPDVPTMAEAGYDNFNVTFWIGMLAPAGVPTAIVQKIYDAAKEVKQDTRAAAALSAQGELLMLEPEQFAKRIQQEVLEWGAIIQKEGLSLE